MSNINNNNNNKLSIFRFEHASIISTYYIARSVIAYNVKDVMEGKLHIGYHLRHPLITRTVKDNYNINDYLPSYIDSGTSRKNVVEFNYSDLIIEFDKVVELIDQSRYSEQLKIKPLKDLLEQIMINWND